MFEALVAEELLLALPIVPLHEDQRQCEQLAAGDAATPVAAAPDEPHAPASTEQTTTRPFADLRALLERGAKGHR